MSYCGSLVLALSLVPGYWLAAVSSQDRYEAASRAFGPPLSSCSPSTSSRPPLPLADEPTKRPDDEESRIDGERETKKTNLLRSKSSSFIFAVLVALFIWGGTSFTWAKDALTTLVFTVIVAIVVIVSTGDVYTTRECNVCRTSEGRLFDPRTSNGGLSQPLTPAPTVDSPFIKVTQVLIVYSSFIIYPLLLLLQNTSLVAPFISLAAIAFTFMISRVVPASKKLSLRWLVLPILVLDALLVFLTIGLLFASDVPVGLVFNIWIKERVDEEWAAHTPDGAAGVESLRKSWFEERRLGAEAQFYRFLLLGVLGWVVAGLYRLDVGLRDAKVQRLEMGEKEERRVEQVDDASKMESNSSEHLITAGNPIAIPPLRQSLQQHSQQALESIPIYFTTSLSVVVGLLVFVPFSLSFVPGHPFVDGTISTGPVNFSGAELLAILLSPPLIALVITLVSAWKGEVKKVWGYEERWGGVKPALASLEDAEGREEVMNDDDALVEVLLSEKEKVGV
ncbi:hypothetical protein BDY24DRAFT_401959 [Mrakia frigida]|uniref:uncharacterized protein n=1 Tax=Mrakia frigida TaxID=29902 RepID=UPI003FCC16DD